MIRVALVSALLLASPVLAQQQTESASGAVLRGLDKISGKVVDIELPAGRSVQFDRLTAYAGLQIMEDGRTDVVFSGWMIASAPALSAMEHARYDVWVMRCTTS